jgi:ADP-ribosylglycohydrolase
MAFKTREELVNAIKQSKRKGFEPSVTGRLDQLIDEDLLQWMISYVYDINFQYKIEVRLDRKVVLKNAESQEICNLFNKYSPNFGTLRLTHFAGQRNLIMEFETMNDPDGTSYPLISLQFRGGSDLRDKFMGCMIGSAIGDAVGEIHQHHEQLSFEDIQKKYPLLEYTDDTAQALVVAEFLSTGDHSIEKLGDLFLDAINTRPDRGYGGTATIFSIAEMNNISCIEARDRFNKAFDYAEGSWSDGAAMRIHPAALYFNRVENLRDRIDFISDIDHSHPIAKEGAYLCAKLITLILNKPQDSELDWARELVRECQTSELLTSMEYVEEALLKQYPASTVDRHLGNINRSTTATQSAVPYAIFSFLLNRDNFDDCLQTAISTKGDADTIGAIACAFSGVRLGHQKISQNMFYELLEDREIIEKRATALLLGSLPRGQRPLQATSLSAEELAEHEEIMEVEDVDE